MHSMKLRKCEAAQEPQAGGSDDPKDQRNGLLIKALVYFKDMQRYH